MALHLAGHGHRVEQIDGSDHHLVAVEGGEDGLDGGPDGPGRSGNQHLHGANHRGSTSGVGIPPTITAPVHPL